MGPTQTHVTKTTRRLCMGPPMEAISEIVRLLMENGANPNARDEDDQTPLYWAAGRGRIEIVRLLMENGADINAGGSREGTPLRGAARGGHIEIVRLLMENGANPNARDEDVWTPLYWAAGRGHIESCGCYWKMGPTQTPVINGGRLCMGPREEAISRSCGC